MTKMKHIYFQNAILIYMVEYNLFHAVFLQQIEVPKLIFNIKLQCNRLFRLKGEDL